MLEKVLKRLRKKAKIRAKITWNVERPRLTIFRSNSNIYAQIIDDISWKTFCSSSDLKMKKEWTKVDMAKKVWEDIASKALSLNLQNVVFDRNGFIYHWRVKALADWARVAGLKF